MSLARARVYWSLRGHPKEALDSARNALKIYRKLGHKLGMAQDYGNIGNILLELGEINDALENHRKALKIHEELGHKLGMANQYRNIGIVLGDLGRPKEALKLLETSLEIFKELLAVTRARACNNISSGESVLFAACMIQVMKLVNPAPRASRMASSLSLVVSLLLSSGISCAFHSGLY